MRGDPLDGADRGVEIRACGARARQDAKRMDADRSRDAERPPGQDARDVGAVPPLQRRRRIAVVGVVAGRPIGRAAREIADPVGASLELAVGAAHAGVDHVGVDAGAIAGWHEAAVERQRALVDAIESPRCFPRRL